jgi:signal transduction histidine kinase
VTSEVDDRGDGRRERLASLGALTAGIAHEIRNPLQFIAGDAEVVVELAEELTVVVEELRSRLSDEAVADLVTLRDELAEAGHQIVRHAHRLEAIVDGMVATSGARARRRRLVDLNEVVIEAARLAGTATSGEPPSLGVDVELVLAPGLGPISADPIRLSQAVLNLVANALQAVDRGTSDGRPPRVRLTTARVGDGQELRIDDNGPGIPTEVRDHLFEPFVTTKPVRAHAGLGLAQAWDTVVVAHGGTLDAVGRPDGGTRMVAWLPEGTGEETASTGASRGPTRP